jgi:hypothetical protein
MPGDDGAKQFNLTLSREFACGGFAWLERDHAMSSTEAETDCRCRAWRERNLARTRRGSAVASKWNATRFGGAEAARPSTSGTSDVG